MEFQVSALLGMRNRNIVGMNKDEKLKAIFLPCDTISVGRRSSLQKAKYMSYNLGGSNIRRTVSAGSEN